uniref:Uncharacterized protein n=1 Tax=Oryza brachyantha TaxID=4533 RepID=J3LE87_ORYBR
MHSCAEWSNWMVPGHHLGKEKDGIYQRTAKIRKAPRQAGASHRRRPTGCHGHGLFMYGQSLLHVSGSWAPGSACPRGSLLETLPVHVTSGRQQGRPKRPVVVGPSSQGEQTTVAVSAGPRGGRANRPSARATNPEARYTYCIQYSRSKFNKGVFGWWSRWDGTGSFIFLVIW